MEQCVALGHDWFARGRRMPYEPVRLLEISGNAWADKAFRSDAIVGTAGKVRLRLLLEFDSKPRENRLILPGFPFAEFEAPPSRLTESMPLYERNATIPDGKAKLDCGDDAHVGSDWFPPRSTSIREVTAREPRARRQVR